MVKASGIRAINRSFPRIPTRPARNRLAFRMIWQPIQDIRSLGACRKLGTDPISMPRVNAEKIWNGVAYSLMSLPSLRVIIMVQPI